VAAELVVLGLKLDHLLAEGLCFRSLVRKRSETVVTEDNTESHPKRESSGGYGCGASTPLEDVGASGLGKGRKPCALHRFVVC
jgi:hypothetical protein